MLLSHDARLEPALPSPVFLSELLLLSTLGRLGVGFAVGFEAGEGVDGIAFVVSLVGSKGVGGDTSGGEGRSFTSRGSEFDCDSDCGG